MRQIWLILLLLLATLLAPLQAEARPPEPDCTQPRAAADSLFVWLQPGHYQPRKAATCLNTPPGASGEQLAVQLKQLLDARGHWVPVPTMPTDPDYRDENGQHKLVPMPSEFPVLALERHEDGRWLYSSATLEQVPRLYSETFSPLGQFVQSNLPPFFYNSFLNLALWQYLYAVMLMLAAWLVGRLTHLLLRTKVKNFAKRLGIPLDEEGYRRLQWPIVALSMGLVFRWGIPDLQLRIGLSQTLYVATSVLIGLSMILVVSRLVDVISTVLGDRAAESGNKLGAQVVPLFRQAARVVVWTIGLLFILQNSGVEVWSFVAGLGIGGLAFALAAQDTIANVFGSLNIFLDRPFQVGDWVKIGDVEGIVEEVGFRSTRIRTFYNSLVTIPNKTLTNSNVDNMGARHRRRVSIHLGVTYGTPPEKLQAFIEGIRAILAAHPSVFPNYEVHFNRYGPSSLDILVWYHLVVPGWTQELEARHETFMEFLRLAHEMGVSFAFPTTSIHVESTPDHPPKPRAQYEMSELEAVAAAFGPGGHLSRPQSLQPSRTWRPQSAQAAGSSDDGG